MTKKKRSQEITIHPKIKAPLRRNCYIRRLYVISKGNARGAVVRQTIVCR